MGQPNQHMLEVSEAQDFASEQHIIESDKTELSSVLNFLTTEYYNNLKKLNKDVKRKKLQ